jgi:hypothetical protein
MFFSGLNLLYWQSKIKNTVKYSWQSVTFLRMTVYRVNSERKKTQPEYVMVYRNQYSRGPHVRPCRKFVRHLCLRLLRLRKFVTSSFQIESVPQIETNNFQTYLQKIRFKHLNIKQKTIFAIKTLQFLKS